MPTQVSAMLGSIVRSSEIKELPYGVFGSYGWSGESVDMLRDKLVDAGFKAAFKPIKVAFRPDAKALQVLSHRAGTFCADDNLCSRTACVPWRLLALHPTKP